MNVTRNRLHYVENICTATETRHASADQAFYETPQTIELWDERPTLRRVKRWPRKAVYWILEGDTRREPA